MARTKNLLNDANALMAFSTKDGTSIGLSSIDYDWTAENATLSIFSGEYVVNTRYVLQVFPNTTDTLSVQLSNIPLTLDDNGRAISANIKIKAASPITTNALLYLDSASASYVGHSQITTSGRYSSVHTNQVSVPDDGQVHTASIRFEISNHNGVNIFLTLPHLIHELAFYENPFVARSRTFLPDFYFEIDSSQIYPSFPFFRLIDVLTSAAGETTIEHNRMYGVEASQLFTPDESTEYWTKSSLVSTRSVRDSYIPWLSQFTGAPIRQNIQSASGGVFFENDGLRRDFIEWQLGNSYYGRAAGSREAMAEAAKQVLTKTKDGTKTTLSVAVTPKFQDDPFLIRVQTLTNETPDADTGESSYLVMQSVSLAKPMGYKIIHETVDEFFFSFDDPTLGVLDQLRWG